MSKIKSLLLAAVFVTFGTSLFAVDATVTFVSGKVEVQRDGKWIALQKGDTVSKSETISTGFQSEAKIKLMESVMYLGPVTRITLEELATVDQTDNVNVYLKTGTARSQVRHVDNKRVNYQVHTAVAVASCRGTDWIVDDSNNVSGLDGIIEVIATSDTSGGKGILVKEKQSVQVNDKNEVSQPVSDVVKTASDVNATATTAASKEGVGGVSASLPADITDNKNNNPYNPIVNVADTPDEPAATDTASVVVTIEIPE